jgi:hypothetical protein
MGIILSIQAFRKVNKNGFESLYVGITILYNPITPIYASKDIWVLFNVITIILLGISLALDKDKTDQGP